MVSLGVRSRLFLVSLGLIAVSLLIADAYLSSALDETLTRRIRDDLGVRLALAQRDAEVAAAPRCVSRRSSSTCWSSSRRAPAKP